MGRAARLRAVVKAASKPLGPTASNVIPFPFIGDITPNKLRQPRARTFLTYAPEDYTRAVVMADGGNLRAAADFCDWIFRDGRVRSAIEQATAWLGLPATFECDPALAAVLAKGYPKLFPESEQAKLWTWGFGFGVGLAREVWTFNHLTEPKCVIETWHPRDLVVRRERDECAKPVDRWYVRTEDGEVPIEPGSGWLLFTPYGLIEPWRFGLWNSLALPVLAKHQCIQDRARTSEVTPILVAITKGLSEPQRKQLLADMRLSEDTRMVLPKDCDIRAVDVSSGVRGGIQKDTIEWADGEIVTVWLGNTVTMDGGSGFNGGEQQAGMQAAIDVKRETAWSTQIGEQLVTPYARIVHGYAGPDDIYPRHLGTANKATPVAADPAAAGPPAAGSPPADVAPAPAAPATPDVAASEVTDDMSDESVIAYAAELTEAQERACEHGRVNVCEACGIERERCLARDDAGALVRDAEGRAVHAIRWRPIRKRVAMGRVAMTLSKIADAQPKYWRAVTRAALSDEPPTEFLIFAWGENESSKGSVWLQEPQASALVTEFGSREGMIDLEHLSLGLPGMPYDPDARGAFDLRLDDRGLWAVNIKWTADGAARIREKRQRYTSPAFNTDGVGGREVVTSLVNVALTALPATRFITPLVAASVTASTRARGTMDDKQLIAFLMTLLGAADNDEIAAKVRAKFIGEDMAPAEEPAPVEDPAAMSEAEVAPDALTALRSLAAGNPAALGALEGLTQAATLATRAMERVTAIEANQEQAERASLIAANRSKFTAEALKKYSAATTPIAELRSFVQFAQPIAASASGAAPKVRESAATEVPAHIRASLGNDEKKIAAFAAKRGEIAARSQRRPAQEAG